MNSAHPPHPRLDINPIAIVPHRKRFLVVCLSRSDGPLSSTPSSVLIATSSRAAGTTFALYTSPDLETWSLVTADVMPRKPGGPGANLYTPVLANNAKFKYFVMMFQCSGGCSDGQLQVATAATPAGPFEPRGAVLSAGDPRAGSSQGTPTQSRVPPSPSCFARSGGRFVSYHSGGAGDASRSTLPAGC